MSSAEDQDDTPSGAAPPDRRARLEALKAEVVETRREAGLPDEHAGRDRELDAFLDNLVEQKARRKSQLALVKGFFADPLRFGAGLKTIAGDDDQTDPLKKRAFLEDQIALLSGILEAAEAELELLDQALKAMDADGDTTA